MSAGSSREVLAQNLNALVSWHAPKLSTQVLARRIGIGNGTLGRLRNAQVECTIETLDQVARYFRLEPWQLLVPGLDPARLPQARGMDPREREMLGALDKLVEARTRR